MHGGKSSDTSVNELLKEGHAEALMALSSRPKSNLLKLPTNSMVTYLILIMIKNMLLHFQSQGD